MKRSQSGLCLVILFFFFGCIYAQPWSGILAPARAIDWSHAGAGTIPARSGTPCQTFSPGATTAQVASALSSCAGTSNPVVYLNPGSYTFTNFTISASNVTLRGAGPDQTFIKFSGATAGCNGFASSICVYSGDGNWWGGPNNGPVSWTATSYAQGQTTITLSSHSNLKVGSQMILWHADDPVGTAGYYACDTGGSSGCSWQGASNSQYHGHVESQNVTVTACGTSTFGASCTSNTVTFTPGIYSPDYSAGKAPQAWWGTNIPMTGVGLENFSIDSTAQQPVAGITLWGSNYCWVKNIRSQNTGYVHVQLIISSHDTIRDSYFYNGSGSSEGYGVNSSNSSADNLIENNISNHLASIAVTEGDAGSVFAYNFAVDNFFGPGTWQEPDSMHHSAGDHYELYEGFLGIGHVLDIIHGTSNMITEFRNKWSGRDTATTTGTKTDATLPYMALYGNRFSNALGNVLGTSGYHNVYQNIPSTKTACGASGTAIYSLGYSDEDGSDTLSCAGAAGPGNDLELQNDILRWGNYSVVTQSSDTPANSGIRFVGSEVPSGNAYFPNPVPAATTLPASFYLITQPSWWVFPNGNTNTPWPAIGPDVTGGNNSTYYSGQTLGGHVYLTPAANCYLNVIGGKLDGSSGWLTFNANTCYPSGTVLQAPTGLNTSVQ